MAYREKDFQTRFTKWARNRYEGTAAFELKLARGNALPFNALETHQKYALQMAKHEQIGFKIPDTGYTNPFDFFTLRGVQAFVVVQYLPLAGTHHPRAFFLIDIDDWCKEEETSERKSLTEARAEEIGTACMLA